jgi:hypothetical protein
MSDAPALRRFQFSLRTLLFWMVALSVLFALARLPYPVNAYFAPLYSSLLFGYLGSRSVWLATILGGLGCLAAAWLITAIEMINQQQPLVLYPFVLPGCCCPPIGAYLGLAIGAFARERRDNRRLRSRLKSLYLEIANPCPPAKPADESPTSPPDQPETDDRSSN